MRAHPHSVLRWLQPGYALALTLSVVAPLLRPGYLLLRDAVSTPRSYLTDNGLGLVSAPRATPQDFAVALASHLVDGGIVVKALLILGLWLGGWGAGRLAATVVPESGAGGQFTATTLAIWNPYVGERLLQGHWSLLLGYGCLPWVATAAIALRSTETICWPTILSLGFWIALAGLTPTGLLLAAAVGLVCVAVGGPAPRWRCAVAVVAGAWVAALPWLTAAALGLSSAVGMWARTPGIAAFAARAEPGLGTLGSLANLGGMWNADAVPDSRSTLFVLISAAVLLSVVGAGAFALRRNRSARPLLALAAGSVTAIAVMATGVGLAALHVVVEAVPGLGVLRDGQKWVALAMPGYALAGAGAVLTLRRWFQPASAALLCCLALILSLPDLAWGAGGKLRSVRYPDDWAAVAAVINQAPAEVAALPTDSMRRFAWAGPAPVLDPLPRWLRADVLTTGDLDVAGTTVLGEGDRARAVQRLLLAGGDPVQLRAAGVGWLVVEKGTPGDMGSAAETLAQLTVAHDGHDVMLYRVGGDTPATSRSRRAVVLVAHFAWLLLLVAGAGGLVMSRRSSAHDAGDTTAGDD